MMVLREILKRILKAYFMLISSMMESRVILKSLQ